MTQRAIIFGGVVAERTGRVFLCDLLHFAARWCGHVRPGAHLRADGGRACCAYLRSSQPVNDCANCYAVCPGAAGDPAAQSRTATAR